MKITADNILIPDAKITQYLLVWRPKNDKSKFLAQAGFTFENPVALIQAIRLHVENAEAVLDRVDDYGQHYRMDGSLIGPNGLILEVVTIWNQNVGETVFRFVTLKPRR